MFHSKRVHLRRLIKTICFCVAISTLQHARAETILPDEGPAAGYLSGIVYFDFNNNGLQETGELGLSGIQVVLTGTLGNDEVITMTTATGDDGTYTFSNLQPGTYRLTKLQEEDLHVSISNPIGSIGGEVISPVEFDQIVLESGDSGSNYNFGEWGLKAIYMSKRDFIVNSPVDPYPEKQEPTHPIEVFPVPEPTTLIMLVFCAISFTLYTLHLRYRR